MTETETVGRKPSRPGADQPTQLIKIKKHAQKRHKKYNNKIKTQIKIGAALRALPGVSVFGLVITMGYYAAGFPGHV